MSDNDPRDAAPFPHADNVGAWVLGALDEETARDFAQELQRSPRLRAEVARLQPVVDALPMGVEQMSPPASLRDRIMATVHEEAQLQRAAAGEPRLAPAPPARRERRGRFLGLRPLTAAGLACAVLAVGVGAGVVLSTSGSGPAGATTVIAKVTFPNGAGQLIDQGRDGGQLKLTGVAQTAPGRVYQVWLMKQGATKPTPTDALFTPNRGGHATVNVPGDLREVDQVLVTQEPAGGSPQPTSDPVVTAVI